MPNRPEIDTDQVTEPSLIFHPYNVILVLTLAGITMLFLAFSAAFVYSRVESNMPPIKLPIIFVFNTLILLASSATMHWAKICYRQDNTAGYQRALISTIVLTILFMVMQYVAWMQLSAQQIYIDTDPSASYLYIISGMHFAHIVAGLPFLFLFLITARRRMKEPVSVLVYFSDPEKRLKLRLLTLYWHFLDALWIYLVLFFYINYLIKA